MGFLDKLLGRGKKGDGDKMDEPEPARESMQQPAAAAEQPSAPAAPATPQEPEQNN